MSIVKSVLSYLPDGDPSDKACITDGVNFIPTSRGIKSAYLPKEIDATACAGTITGMASLMVPSGVAKLLVGTPTDLYEMASLAWTSTTRTENTAAGGGSYTAATSWCFAQFGDFSLAASRSNALQYCTAATAATFHNVCAGAGTAQPWASLVEVVDNFVFTADYKSSSSGTAVYDGYWCAAVGTYNSWTPSIATQCVQGRLSSIPGKITVLRKFGSQLFVGKRNGAYLGSYVGGNTIWDFQALPTDDGPAGHRSCIFIGTPDLPVLFYLGYTDFYIFDGARPRPIGGAVREWFFNSVNIDSLDTCVSVHDPLHKLVYLFFPTATYTYPNKALIYHYPTNRWGRVDVICYGASTWQLATGNTYDKLLLTFSNVGVTYGTMPSRNATYTDVFGSVGRLPIPLIAGEDNKLYTMESAAPTATIELGVFGSADRRGLIRTLSPVWIDKPDALGVVFEVSDDMGTYSTSASACMTNNRVDAFSDGNFHRLTLNIEGEFELNKLPVDVIPTGTY